MSGVSRPHLFFTVSRLFFTLLRDWQSGETIFSALPEPILNVDMLIVTFKFLPRLTAHENTLLLYYRSF